MLSTRQGEVQIHRLSALADAGFGQTDRLPFSIKVLLESVLRNVDGFSIMEDDVRAVAGWDAKSARRSS